LKRGIERIFLDQFGSPGRTGNCHINRGFVECPQFNAIAATEEEDELLVERLTYLSVAGEPRTVARSDADDETRPAEQEWQRYAGLAEGQCIRMRDSLSGRRRF
jgi:hypothetical protein